MTKQAERFQQCDRLISRFEQVCRQAAGRPGAKYRCGVDLGTACVVLAGGAHLDEATLAKARQQQITVLATDEAIFEAALAIHQKLHD